MVLFTPLFLCYYHSFKLNLLLLFIKFCTSCTGKFTANFLMLNFDFIWNISQAWRWRVVNMSGTVFQHLIFQFYFLEFSVDCKFEYLQIVLLSQVVNIVNIMCVFIVQLLIIHFWCFFSKNPCVVSCCASLLVLTFFTFAQRKK